MGKVAHWWHGVKNSVTMQLAILITFLGSFAGLAMSVLPTYQPLIPAKDYAWAMAILGTLVQVARMRTIPKPDQGGADVSGKSS